LKEGQGCQLTTLRVMRILEITDGPSLAPEERDRRSAQACRRAGLARRSWRQSRLGTDLLSLQRRGMSLRRVLHHQCMEHAEEPWQPRTRLAARRGQLHHAP